jgi:putative oxidoreductase
VSANATDLHAAPAGTTPAQGGAAPLALIGRAAFVAIFLTSGPMHFTQQVISYAAQQGVPAAPLLVPIAGLLALAGGLSILLGYRAKVGAWLLVVFLIPVTIMMHNFWAVTDPMMAQMQRVMFMKNVSMLGAALLIAVHGAGPLSLDARRAGRTN